MVRVNVLFTTVSRKKTNAEKHCSRRVKMNALFLQNVMDRLLSGAESCPREEFPCPPPYKCQDSHNSDVLPISQSINRNTGAECLFNLRINDIHTPFRHFELTFYAFDAPPAKADPSGSRKIVQTPSNTRIVISMSKVVVVLFCKTDAPENPVHYSSLEEAIQWCDTVRYLGWPMTVYLVDYHGSDRKGAAEIVHDRPSC